MHSHLSQNEKGKQGHIWLCPLQQYHGTWHPSQVVDTGMIIREKGHMLPELDSTRKQWVCAFSSALWSSKYHPHAQQRPSLGTRLTFSVCSVNCCSPLYRGGWKWPPMQCALNLSPTSPLQFWFYHYTKFCWRKPLNPCVWASFQPPTPSLWVMLERALYINKPNSLQGFPFFPSFIPSGPFQKEEKVFVCAGEIGMGKLPPAHCLSAKDCFEPGRGPPLQAKWSFWILSNPEWKKGETVTWETLLLSLLKSYEAVIPARHTAFAIFYFRT